MYLITVGTEPSIAEHIYNVGRKTGSGQRKALTDRSFL